MTEYYVGLYTSEEDCGVELLFGESNTQARDIEREKFQEYQDKLKNKDPNDLTEEHVENFNWKYIKLPCPKCMKIHTFKRSTYYSNIELGN